MIRTATKPAVTGIAAAGLLVLLAACERPIPESELLAIPAAYADRVHFVDPATGEARAELRVDPNRDAQDGPSDVATLPDGRYLVLLGDAEPALWLMPRTGRRPEQIYPLPGLRSAARVVLSPEGGRAFVSEYFLGNVQQPGQVAVVDLSSGEVRQIPTCLAPYGLSVSPDGSRLAVSCSLADAVAVYDTRSLERVAQFNLTPEDMSAGGAGNPVIQPMGIEWSPAGDRLWVAMMRTDQVGSYTPDGLLIRRSDVGDAPVSVHVTGLGRTVLVASRLGTDVSVVDARTGEVIRRIPLEDALHPHDMVLSADGRVAYVVYEGGPEQNGGVIAIEIESGEVLWSRETGPFSLGVDLLPGIEADAVADDEGP